MTANTSSGHTKTKLPTACLYPQERTVKCLLLVCAFCLADFEGNKRLLASPWRVAALRNKRSPNACLPNPCQHQAHCQLMKDRPICNCRPGFTGAFCQDVVLKLTCEEGRMKMIVRKEAFNLLKIPKQLVHLRNQACKVSEMEERGELFFAATLTGENHTACGSVIQQNGSHVSYSNVMESGWDTHGVAIPENFQLELNFSCDYAYERVVRLPAGPTTADRPAQFEVREGHFNVSMGLYKTASYLQPYHLPAEAVPIKDTLYVLLEIEGQHQLSFLLSVEGCWGTASTDPYQEAQHKLIEEGCPYDETVIYLNSFGESATAKFRFQMFQIVSYTKVFLHCRVQLCLPSGPEPCAKQCPRHWRSKRALANDYSKIASYGPIHVLGKMTNHSRNDQKDPKGMYVPLGRPGAAHRLFQLSRQCLVI
ncbi:uromodulin-like [Pezoporus wallicus]|uniref:uromodulin-like n=1 Tax=Pezoporus wallicus TaxID=35540 RepID=UPI00254A8F97|nr:uromodulin-like [Pezoporus wallicus]